MRERFKVLEKKNSKRLFKETSKDAIIVTWNLPCNQLDFSHIYFL